MGQPRHVISHAADEHVHEEPALRNRLRRPALDAGEQPGRHGSSYSSFFNKSGDFIVIRTINQQTAAHQWHAGSVQTWDKISYPSDPVAYVKYYMDAYLDGNTARMTKLGNQTMTTHFMGLASKPDSSYTVGTPDGTAGHTHIEVTEASVSFDVIFRLANQNLGQANAIEGCDSGC
ncbi:MAG TPA: hypothetical protein VFR11_10295 [Micromonosporaceae bacterium]|nr:hypothetical protein [Micromonosporaceae bacterium]